MPKDLKKVINNTFSLFPEAVSTDLCGCKNFLTTWLPNLYVFLHLNVLPAVFSYSCSGSPKILQQSLWVCSKKLTPQSHIFNYRNTLQFLSLGFCTWSLMLNFLIFGIVLHRMLKVYHFRVITWEGFGLSHIDPAVCGGSGMKLWLGETEERGAIQ